MSYNYQYKPTKIIPNDNFGITLSLAKDTIIELQEDDFLVVLSEDGL